MRAGPFAIAAAFVLTLSSQGDSTRGAPICHAVPDNALSIPAGESSGLSASDFNEITTFIASRYSPVFEATGKTLVLRADWNDERVNSFATRDSRGNPVVVAPGGLARYPGMTRDALLAVYCHELGHFLGGAPKAPRGDSGLLSWSSAEGQADYFSTAKCLRTLFDDEGQNAAAVSNVAPASLGPAEARCASASSKNQCLRIVEASRALAQVYAAIQGLGAHPSLDRSDSSEVPETIYSHPQPQCRLDTFVEGVLCAIDPSVPFQDSDPQAGACARPRCWFYPN